jgi:hypothetical protein
LSSLTKISSVFSLISEILSSTCSSLLEWPSAVFLFNYRDASLFS